MTWWIKVPKAAAQAAGAGAVSPRAFVLYVLLLGYADKDGLAWPSNDTLAEATSSSRASVKRWLVELAEVGWVTRQPGRTRVLKVHQMVQGVHQMVQVPQMGGLTREPGGLTHEPGGLTHEPGGAHTRAPRGSHMSPRGLTREPTLEVEPEELEPEEREPEELARVRARDSFHSSGEEKKGKPALTVSTCHVALARVMLDGGGLSKFQAQVLGSVVSGRCRRLHTGPQIQAALEGLGFVSAEQAADWAQGEIPHPTLEPDCWAGADGRLKRAREGASGGPGSTQGGGPMERVISGVATQQAAAMEAGG